MPSGNPTPRALLACRHLSRWAGPGAAAKSESVGRVGGEGLVAATPVPQGRSKSADAPNGAAEQLIHLSRQICQPIHCGNVITEAAADVLLGPRHARPASQPGPRARPRRSVGPGVASGHAALPARHRDKRPARAGLGDPRRRRALARPHPDRRPGRASGRRPARGRARTRLAQPRLPEGVWTVTELTSGTAFTWTSTSPGVRVTASHVVEPSPEGSRLTLAVDLAGRLAPVGWLMTRLLTQRYVETEAASIKAAAEAG